MPTVLKEGAVIVADSHYSIKNPRFLDFLKKVDKQKIETSQLILLGDNFDLLIGGIKETQAENREAIDLLNKIGQSIEVVYFEGNHDFNLSKLFNNLTIVPIERQPVLFQGREKTVSLSHGDKNSGMFHSLFTFFIRNSLFLQFLNLITLNFLNSRYAYRKIEDLKEKKICRTIENFENIIKKKYSEKTCNCDFIVEGHYHQGTAFSIGKTKYLNVESFACNQSYIVVEYLQNGIEFKSKTL